MNGDKLPFIVNKTLSRKKHQGESSEQFESVQKNQLRGTAQTTPLKFADISQSKVGSGPNTNTVTKYIEPFFKQNEGSGANVK